LLTIANSYHSDISYNKKYLNNMSKSGPELRGSNITLETITKSTDPHSRQTKIICTLGPACWDVPMLESLIEAGMSVARFNFSHGDHEGHKACLDRLREASKNKNRHVGKKIMEFTPFLEATVAGYAYG
jgi:Pyruvate kinase, barrel domain